LGDDRHVGLDVDHGAAIRAVHPQSGTLGQT
jgi:hypothetical protein